MTAQLVILALWVLAAGGVALIVGRIAARRDQAARAPEASASPASPASAQMLSRTSAGSWTAAVDRSRRLDAKRARLEALLNGRHGGQGRG